MFDEQDGVCAICGRPETKVLKGKKLSLSIDHDHETGKVRGLLCMDCNTSIGKFKHNKELLLNAVRYLDEY